MPIIDTRSFLVGRDAINYSRQPLNSMWGEGNSHGGGANNPAQDQLDSIP